MRRIVMVAVEAETREHETIIFALCEDGTLWAKTYGDKEGVWGEIEGIPDREPRYPSTDPKAQAQIPGW
jgi:hypothetical protein